MTAQPGRPAADGERICDTRLRDSDPGAPDFTCTAVAGHPAGTLHAAYGTDGTAHRTWPQEGERPDWLPSEAELAEAKADRKRASYIDGLRQLADALEQHPEVPLPYQGSASEMTFHFLDGDDPRAAMAATARALPCSWRKEIADYSRASYLELHGEIAGLRVYLTAYRDAVCTRRVVGTEEKEVEEEVRPAETRKVRRQVEKVVWDCAPILSDRAAVERVTGAEGGEH